MNNTSLIPVLCCCPLVEEDFQYILWGKTFKTEKVALHHFRPSFDPAGYSVWKKEEGSQSEGTLLYLETQEDYWRLDQWQEVPKYARKKVTVQTEEQEREAWIYVREEESQEGHVLPSHEAVKEELIRFKQQVDTCTIPFMDSYIFVPCYIEDFPLFLEKIQACPLEDASGYLEKLNETSKIEFSNHIENKFKRTILAQKEIVISSEYKTFHEMGRQFANIILSWHEHTKLAVLTISLPLTSFTVHQLLDNMVQDNLYVQEEDGRVLLLMDWLRQFSLIKVGTSRAVLFPSSKEQVSDKLLHHMLAVENELGRNLKGKKLIQQSHENLAEYDWYELYASEKCVVMIDQVFEDLYEDRIYEEILLLFIIELIVFQDASINYVNEKVLEELEIQDDSILGEIQVIEDLAFEHSRSLVFWDSRNYRYTPSQNLADAIFQAFQIDKVISLYEKNKTVLEQLLMIHSNRISEQESKSINNLLMVLTMFQSLPVMYDIYSSIIQETIHIKNLISSTLGLGTCLILWGTFYKLQKVRKLKRLGLEQKSLK